MAALTAKILHVDLGAETTHVEEIPEPVLRRHLGGGGLAAYLLLRDPIQSANVRAKIHKALLGLRAHGCGRIVIVAHSGGTMASYMTLGDAAYEIAGADAGGRQGSLAQSQGWSGGYRTGEKVTASHGGDRRSAGSVHASLRLSFRVCPRPSADGFRFGLSSASARARAEMATTAGCFSRRSMLIA